MTACALVTSSIIHVRHGQPSHRLERQGLSIWLDLDHLETAHHQSVFFSIGRFNLLSFHQGDYGWNFKSKEPVRPLAAYVRNITSEIEPGLEIDQIRLLTFPRILGVSFNPISVYLCSSKGQDKIVIYEVRNTFGDMHSYIGKVEGNGPATHQVDKNLHVSPFFSMDGGYRLRLNADEKTMRLLIHYHDKGTPRLTATLRGCLQDMTTKSILSSFVGTGQFPLRPLFSIHIEAAKLWLKKVSFFRRPQPMTKKWTMANIKGNKP